MGAVAACPHITRLQADRNYTLIHVASGRNLLVSLALKIVEERLRAYGFVWITRGDVINLTFTVGYVPTALLRR